MPAPALPLIRPEVQQRAKATFLIADSHPHARRGLATMLAEQPDWQVCGDAGDLAQTLQLLRQLRPTVLILDLELRGLGGLARLKALREASPGTAHVLLSDLVLEQFAERVVRTHQAAFVLRTDPPETLMTAILMVLNHCGYLSPTVAAHADSQTRPLRPTLASLSERELEVLRQVALGQTAAAIGEQLGISAKTVETYRLRLMDKLGIHDVPGLVRLALRAGLIGYDQ